MKESLKALLDLLDLEQIENDIFRGRTSDERRQRVFGGQVAGQALVAAGRTVPVNRPVHSLHAYFIRPGDPLVPIVYTVDRVRDGRSFTTRRVTAVQHGKAIFTLSASFQIVEDGPDTRGFPKESDGVGRMGSDLGIFGRRVCRSREPSGGILGVGSLVWLPGSRRETSRRSLAVGVPTVRGAVGARDRSSGEGSQAAICAGRCFGPALLRNP